MLSIKSTIVPLFDTACKDYQDGFTFDTDETKTLLVRCAHYLFEVSARQIAPAEVFDSRGLLR